MDLKARARGASDLKLTLWLNAARRALSMHDRDEPDFRDVRTWVREQRRELRGELVERVEILEAERAQRVGPQPPPGT
jgi:hypothetical protein